MIQFENATSELQDRQSFKKKHRQLEREEQMQKEKQIERQRKKNARNARSRRKLQGLGRSKSRLSRSRSHKKEIEQLPFILSMFSLGSVARPTSNDSAISSQASLLEDSGISDDVLGLFIEELNNSKKENWRKWIIMAMLFEFDINDVIKGVWMLSKYTCFFFLIRIFVREVSETLSQWSSHIVFCRYTRKKTVADFYEKIYGETGRSFLDYLSEWGEDVSDIVPLIQPPSVGGHKMTESMDGTQAFSLTSDVSMHGSIHSVASSGTSLHARSPSPYFKKEALSSRALGNAENITARKSGNSVLIQGPKQNSIYSSLATSNEKAIMGSPSFPKQHRGARKLSKMLDVYLPPKI